VRSAGFKMGPIMDSLTEIEIKLAFPSVAEALEKIRALGAVEGAPRVFEDNLLFEHDDHPVRENGQTLRLRRAGSRSILTLKSKVKGEFRHKVRLEDETAVADGDAIERVFLGLGFRPSWRYQKFRTTFRLDDLQIYLDETALGCYVELEGPGDLIDAAAARLGYGPESYIKASYRRLQESVHREQGTEPGDLLIAEEDRP